MARSKKLVVPQEGTQPATMRSPIDNMFQGANQQGPEGASLKKGTTFSLDMNLCARFKVACAQEGRTMSSVIEEMITDYLGG